MKCFSPLLFALFLCVLQSPTTFAITDKETEEKQQKDFQMYKDAYERFKEKIASAEEKDKDKKKSDKEETTAKTQTPPTNTSSNEKQLTTNLFKDATYDKFSNQTANNTPFNKSDIRE